MNNPGIKIEKGIPIPVSQIKGVSEALRRTEIGDSFLISLKSRAGIYTIATRQKVKVKCAYDEKEPTKIRVWRVE
jgi:hypothetical protein